MEEFPHADGQTGLGLQRWEQVIQTGRNCLTRIRQDIEETRAKRDEHRAQWREALREYKTVEKLRERQLQEVSQNERILMQKMTDEASISSHWRKTGNDPESQ